MKLLKTRNTQLKERAVAGDGKASFRLARNYYLGVRFERSLPLARYWAFKALQAGYMEAGPFYKTISAPHYTGNEYYKSFGERYGFSLSSNGIWGSSRFRGEFDRHPEFKQWYRTYHVVRILLLYLPVGCYRVIEAGSGQYKVPAREYGHLRESGKWWLLNLIWIAPVLLLVLF